MKGVIRFMNDDAFVLQLDHSGRARPAIIDEHEGGLRYTMVSDAGIKS